MQKAVIEKNLDALYWLCLAQFIQAYFYLDWSMFALTDMKMTATCLVLPDVFGDDPSLFVIVNEKVCSISMITGLTFHIFIFKGRMALYLEVCFVIFTNIC